jgi:hypothetical protein
MFSLSYIDGAWDPPFVENWFGRVSRQNGGCFIKCLLVYSIWLHDTQHNEIQHNDTQHNDIQHNKK